VKKVLLLTLLSLFSTHLLSAQTGGPVQTICVQPSQVPLSSSPTGQLTSFCNPPPDPTPTPTPAPTPVSGFVEPKYVVLTVTYAPPGSASSVTYSNSTLLGTSSMISNSFTNGVNVTASITTGFSFFGLFGSSITTTSTAQLSQESDTSSSVALNETTNMSTTIRGPASSAVGLDHDEDIIWIWLNPAIGLKIDNTGTNFTWTGYAFDQNDPAGTTDIIGIPVKYLNGHAPMPSNIADVLARRWAPRTLCTSADPACGLDGTKDPGLDAVDLAAILRADPFSKTSYVINIPSGGSCTADGRFCRTTNPNLQYSPPPPGGQPVTQTFSIQHQTTAAQGQGATDTRSVSIGTQGNIAGSFFVSLGAKLSVADTLTWTNKWNAMSSSQVGQMAAASITGPSSADNYTGPVEFDIFQDNIYGTFMFGFIPQPTFNLFASPSSQSVVEGNCTSYTASVSALVSGFSSTVSFSLGSALPANATASFSPASVTGAGSSTLTVCTAASTPVGTSNLTINATSGIEVHTTSVSLTVNAPPPPPQPGDFTLTAPTLVHSITAGVATSYTITVSPLNGFTGTVALSADSSFLPDGTTASLSPASIAGSGSSTLTISTSTFSSPGTYTIPVTGVSGNLSHSANVTLTIKSSTTCGTKIICQIQ
jgi:hypothetical protein